MPRTSSTDDPTPDEAAAEEVEPLSPEPTEAQAQMNEVMEAEGTSRPDATPTGNVYPPDANVLNAENVRRFPELFTEEQIASIPTDELPETDTEKAQREAAEAAEAAEAG